MKIVTLLSFFFLILFIQSAFAENYYGNYMCSHSAGLGSCSATGWVCDRLDNYGNCDDYVPKSVEEKSNLRISGQAQDSGQQGSVQNSNEFHINSAVLNETIGAGQEFTVAGWIPDATLCPCSIDLYEDGKFLKTYYPATSFTFNEIHLLPSMHIFAFVAINSVGNPYQSKFNLTDVDVVESSASTAPVGSSGSSNLGTESTYSQAHEPQNTGQSSGQQDDAFHFNNWLFVAVLICLTVVAIFFSIAWSLRPRLPPPPPQPVIQLRDATNTNVRTSVISERDALGVRTDTTRVEIEERIIISRKNVWNKLQSYKKDFFERGLGVWCDLHKNEVEKIFRSSRSEHEVVLRIVNSWKKKLDDGETTTA
ncbi:MAG: hypothetical protein WAN47_05815 [Nitrosotalea sp.]